MLIVAWVSIRGGDESTSNNPQESSPETAETYLDAPSTLMNVQAPTLPGWGRTSCIVINLARNSDRMRVISSAYHASDMASVIPMRRFDAIDAALLPDLMVYLSPRAKHQLTETLSMGYRKRHADLTPGAVGCFLSHVTVLRMLAEDAGVDTMLILEDDADIRPDILARVSEIGSILPSRWDLVMLGHHYQVLDHSMDPLPLIRKVHTFWGTHAYFVTKKAARIILENFERRRIMLQYDSQLSTMSVKGELCIFTTKLSHGISSNATYSDIQLTLEENRSVNPYELLEGFNDVVETIMSSIGINIPI